MQDNIQIRSHKLKSMVLNIKQVLRLYKRLDNKLDIISCAGLITAVLGNPEGHVLHRLFPSKNASLLPATSTALSPGKQYKAEFFYNQNVTFYLMYTKV